MRAYTVRKGFTLLELMTVVAIVAVFTAIAVPAYNQYIRKSERAAAQSYMLKIAGDLGRWRSKNLSYGNFTPATCEAALPGGLCGYETTAHTSILLPIGSTTANYKYRVTLVDIACRATTTTLIRPAPISLTSTCAGLGWVMIGRPNSGDATDTATSKGVFGSASRLVLDSSGVRCMTPSDSSSHISDALIATAATSDAALCGSSSQSW